MLSFQLFDLLKTKLKDQMDIRAADTKGAVVPDDLAFTPTLYF